MAVSINLDLVKSHLRIAHNDEDLLLQDYVEAAILYVQNYIDDLLFETKQEAIDNEGGVVIDAAIRSAILLAVGELYENRESSTPGNYKAIPTIENLLRPYRRVGV